MKVLLICLILTTGSYSNEESNTTSSTTPSPKADFESLKLPIETNTTSSWNQTTTETPKEIQNATSEQPPITFKKKPYVKIRKIKNIYKSPHADRIQKEKDEYNDLKRQESKSIGRKPYHNSIQITHNSPTSFIDPIKNYSIKYKGAHDSIRGEKRISENFETARNFLRTRYYPYGETKMAQYLHRFNKNDSGDKNPQESRQNENYVQYSYKLDSSNDIQDSFRAPPKLKGRPTLPEIQNVIHTLDSQDSTPQYKSPKQNHIVEVTEVPLVFEHHYQGDYKNPQSNFVAHQYSYSPPADTTNEAYRLGKILSQNVVQKLEADEEPLKEYVHDQQELILAGYTHGVPTYSFVNVNLNPPNVNLQKTPHSHPLMKYLAPEITPQSFSNEIKHFAAPQSRPYQFVGHKTHMEPIVVPEDESVSGYGTTYLQAINGQRPQNHNEVQRSNSHQQTRVEDNVSVKSPYSVNIKQHFVNIPKYTVANFGKPQAIHEVEPPNLSGLANTYNFNAIQYQVPVAVPTPLSEIIQNPSYNGLQTGEDQKEEHEQQLEHPRLEFGPPSTKLIHYVLPQTSPSTPPVMNQHVPQVMTGRPYWRKPQVMKLVRVPERVNHPQEEHNYQSHYQSYRVPENFEGDPRIRNQHLYQSLAEHYTTPVRMQQILRNPKQYRSNIMSLVPKQTPLNQNQEMRYHFNERPIVVEESYDISQQNNEEGSRDSNYVHETHQNQISEVNMDAQNYQNDNQDNVEIVKSVSKYYPQPQENNQGDQSLYENSEMQDERGSVLPKGYMSFQSQRNVPRVPNPRHIMPLVRYRNRENYDASRRVLNPRIRRLVSDLMKDHKRRQNVYVLMTEEE